jgi:hypothetical protein
MATHITSTLPVSQIYQGMGVLAVKHSNKKFVFSRFKRRSVLEKEIFRKKYSVGVHLLSRSYPKNQAKIH